MRECYLGSKLFCFLYGEANIKDSEANDKLMCIIRKPYTNNTAKRVYECVCVSECRINNVGRQRVIFRNVCNKYDSDCLSSLQHV